MPITKSGKGRQWLKACEIMKVLELLLYIHNIKNMNIYNFMKINEKMASLVVKE